MKTHLRGHRLMSLLCCSCEHILPPPQWRGRTVSPPCTCGLKSPLPLGFGDSPTSTQFRDSSRVHCTCVYLSISSVWGGQEGRIAQLAPDYSFLPDFTPPDLLSLPSLPGGTRWAVRAAGSALTDQPGIRQVTPGGWFHFFALWQSHHPVVKRTKAGPCVLCLETHTVCVSSAT